MNILKTKIYISTLKSVLNHRLGTSVRWAKAVFSKISSLEEKPIATFAAIW